MSDDALTALQARFPAHSRVVYHPRRLFTSETAEVGHVRGYSSSGGGVFVDFPDQAGAKYVQPEFLLPLHQSPWPPPAAVDSQAAVTNDDGSRGDASSTPMVRWRMRHGHKLASAEAIVRHARHDALLEVLQMVSNPIGMSVDEAVEAIERIYR